MFPFPPNRRSADLYVGAARRGLAEPRRVGDASPDVSQTSCAATLLALAAALVAAARGGARLRGGGLQRSGGRPWGALDGGQRWRVAPGHASP
jgi:hypothetical protein